jgi:Family of unknown function (DUF6519)/Right handed beta helix region
MKGDFSSRREERRHNFTGVLHQQGRVLLDSDWNAQTIIVNDWQDTAAQDIIGAGVAAVPSDDADGFQVMNAEHTAGATDVKLTVMPGRVWVDGILARLYGNPDPDKPADKVPGVPDPEPITAVSRMATYLKEPADPISAGKKDAVILEVWREELNGFQMPAMLIEPALGGPDTTERVRTAVAFRLLRLSAGQTCEDIPAADLHDDWSKKGKLKVSLKAPGAGGTPDCPTVGGGGYTGFEHNLYRIEVARLDGGQPQFKWSQYGGGLVGRGRFTAGSPNKVAIKANLQAITNTGLQDFYLEFISYDEGRGLWRTTYGAPATLSNDELTLSAKLFGTPPTYANATETSFFRLWNGIATIQSFASENELPNNVGIMLDFEAPAAGNYAPEDYWTFDVRVPGAEALPNQPLINNEAPQGIHYSRAPLGVLTWKDNTSVDQNTIEDCRHIFHPLTKQTTCCSYRVGDGKHSWGDYKTITEALKKLPADGGEICVLPGEYKENIEIKGKRNITIKGCGARTRIISPQPGGTNPAAPIINIDGSRNIRIESLSITAHKNGQGLLLEGPDMQGQQGGTLRDITLENLSVEAATRCAIEVHIGFNVTVRGCDVEMSDEPSAAPGIFFAGDDSLIEENIIRVVSVKAKAAHNISGGRTLDTELFMPAEAGPGGLHLGGTSERVRVVNNLIQGGTGNGITLGTTGATTDGKNVRASYPGSKGVVDQRGKDLDLSQPPSKGTGQPQVVSVGALHDISIERNLIYNMGANGIGVAAFFDLQQQDEFVSVDRLTITGNEIRNCLNRNIAVIGTDMLNSIGYGGIALADVEYLVIRDNVIEDNGQNHLMPVCGIYVLHGEGIDISRNRILNNGANDGRSAKGALPGARGGIYITYGVAPRVPVLIEGSDAVPAQNGVAAVKVHDNSVSAPLGQALAMVALGPVSVVGNQLATHGIVGLASSSTTWASTVLIFNLGLSNELYMQLMAFSAVAQGQVKVRATYELDDDQQTLFRPQPGLDDAVLGGYLANGNVLFANNQCTLDLVDRVPDFALSSVLIASLDDISFHGNQCDCDLFLGDLIVTQAILFGISLRMTDNRFKEGIWSAWLSAVTLGLLNMTTNNQSTHCLLVLGSAVEEHTNTSLLDVFNRELCAPFRRIGRDFGKPPTETNKPPTQTNRPPTQTTQERPTGAAERKPNKRITVEGPNRPIAG